MKLHKARPLLYHHMDKSKFGLVDRILIDDERDEPDFNRRMFAEDFGRLFSFSDRYKDDFFELNSNDPDLAERLLSDVRTNHSGYSTDETIKLWVEDIAQSLVSFGSAYYWLSEDQKNDKLHISPFGTSGVIRLLGRYFQWIPIRKENHWDKVNEELPREIRILDRYSVLDFRMPKPLRRMISLQNKTLAVLDRHQLGTTKFFPHATHENPNPTSHFDFNVWKETQDNAFYRSTRQTGWNGRKYSSSKRSDFFDCHRLIRFRRNQLTLRNDVINQLGGQLTKVGRRYRSDFSIQIKCSDALPSIEQLDLMEEKLESEQIGFSQVLDYCFER